MVHKGVLTLKIKIYLSVAMLGSLWWTGTGSVEASVSHPFWDVPSYFQTIRDARESVVNRRQAEAYVCSAKAYVKEAKLAMEQAKTSLEEAERNKKEAGEGLEEARKQLKIAEQELEKAKEKNRMAQKEAVARRQEADQAGQAVAEKEQEVSTWQSEASDQAGAGNVESSSSREEREKRIRKAWAAVDYAPSYLEEIRQQIDGEESVEETTEEVETISSDLEAAEDELSQLEDLLDEKEEAASEAESAAEEAKQEVADWMDAYQVAQRDIKDSESWLAEAERDRAIGEKDLVTSQKEMGQALQEEQQSQYELNHLGEGVSATTGMEYASWKGKESRGHQWVLPYSVYANFHKSSISLSTGYLLSSISSGSGEGTVHHLTDTSLEWTVKNNHKKNETHYILGLNLPTGKSDTHPDAAVPSLLGRYTTFGEGWNMILAIEGVHHFNEVDSLTGRISYGLRGSYTMKQWAIENQQILASHVSPGNQWTEELRYIHAGDSEQLLAFLRHNSTSSMTQRLETGESMSSQEGDTWDFGLFYSQPISHRDSWQAYWLHSHEDPQSGAYASLSGGMSYDGLGLGLTRQYNPSQRGHVMMHGLWGKGHTENWRSGLGTSEPKWYSLEAGWEWKVNERDTIRFMGERYLYQDHSLGQYHGWNLAVYGSHTY